jgi:hypothetical protein
MNVYRLYQQNSHRAGFWVQHRTWINSCAQVCSIAGKSSGALPGLAPLHDLADVMVHVFDVRSGRLLERDSILKKPDDRNYALIAEPFWYERSLRSGAKQGIQSNP